MSITHRKTKIEIFKYGTFYEYKFTSQLHMSYTMDFLINIKISMYIIWLHYFSNF